MIRLYTPILMLEIFCIYHIYKHKSAFYWYFLIFFFPFLGSIIYLFIHYYNRRNVDSITEGVKSLLNTNYELEQLEKEAKYADTVSNRLKLADKHTELGNYDRAIDLYNTCLTGFNKDDPEMSRKALKAHYLNKNYQKVVELGNQLLSDRAFNKSPEKVAYAWALFHQNQSGSAELIFNELDQQYSNYAYRLEFAQFLHESGKTEEAIIKLKGLLAEIDSLDRMERRNNKQIYKMIRTQLDAY